MTLKNLLIQIIIRFVFAILFIWLAVDAVNTAGWGFMAIVSVLFATSDIIKGVRMFNAYVKIKDSIDKN
ncbi:DUF4305 domain-containing protein [Trichococcus sp. K1Tr]|uniref:DUF4305 domain-containing protein n=1 Tax=Trichococcus sp. K1Tr TaxID=3020847 RepID=UPI00232B1129|nr:DUF4305 domain-containing protein [Trichococcus sp. K1Tr]MDB6353210.1 DUF4305 domain-containing protein [Trichococcus sp. K1Tr]